MSKTYVIADLHGRFDLLLKAFEIIEKEIRLDDGDKIVTLGDYVDRGPQSRQIIQFLRGFQNGGAAYPEKLVCLRGNHEAMMLEVLENPLPSKVQWWLGNGGGATLISYGHPTNAPFDGSHVDANDLAWLLSLPVVYLDEHRVFVHAGVERSRPLVRQSEHEMMWRIYKGSSNDFEGGYQPHPDEPMRHVVHGHHQHNDVKRFEHRTDLDTYAWRTGRLAIGVFDSNVPGGPVDILWAKGPSYEDFMREFTRAA